ncbi:MAG: SPOR domain-containing protein [Deltaproteobacteria bacterium]|jgi:cytoskeletal protein RodZ|nr:SPOR domain-containing protein [Deltaproteobacteria bacterium]
MKTSPSSGQGQAPESPTKRAEKRSPDDLNKANAVIAQEINFFDHHRVRSLGGQLAGQAAAAAVRRLTPIPANGPSLEPAPSLEPSPSLAPKAKVTNEAPALDQAEKKKKASWLDSIKWLTRLFLSLVFLVWIFILGVMVGRGSLWDYPENGFLKAQGPSTPPVVEVEPAVRPEPEKPSLAAKNANLSPIETPASHPEAQVIDLELLEERPLIAANNRQSSLDPDAASDPKAPSRTSATSAVSQVSLKDDSPKGPELQALSQPFTTTADAATPSTANKAKAPEVEVAYWPDKPAGEGLYTVQIALARTEKEAKSIVEAFKKRDFPAYYYEKDKTRFPVRVGRYMTPTEAEVAKIKLSKSGASSPYVSKLN